jgi:hypothetical protein
MIRQSNWACAIVVTKDGVVKWSARSQFFDGWISRQLHPWSAAAGLLKSEGREEAEDVVPAQVWIEAASPDEEQQEQVLREQSRRMGEGYVYTLITSTLDK